MEKCHFPSGISIKPDRLNELDPCIYKEIECDYPCYALPAVQPH